jgi:hypothetical protein
MLLRKRSGVGPSGRQLLDGFDGTGRAVPSQEMQLLWLQRVRRLEELLELVDGARGQPAYVLQIALERRAVGNRKDSVIALLLAVLDLLDFQDADGNAAQNKARISGGIVDDQDIKRVRALVDGMKPQS